MLSQQLVSTSAQLLRLDAEFVGLIEIPSLDLFAEVSPQP